MRLCSDRQAVSADASRAAAASQEGQGVGCVPGAALCALSEHKREAEGVQAPAAGQHARWLQQTPPLKHLACCRKQVRACCPGCAGCWHTHIHLLAAPAAALNDCWAWQQPA